MLAAEESLSLKNDITSTHIPLSKTSHIVTPKYKEGWEMCSSWEPRKGRKVIFGEEPAASSMGEFIKF